MKIKKLTGCLLLSLGFVTYTNADTTNGNQSPIIKAGGNVTVNYSPSKEEINKIADNLLKKYKDTLDEKIKKSITEAISNLGKGQNIAGTEQQIKDAFAALKRGDTSEAKALFTKTAENAVENAKTAKQSENEANKQAAEAYRNLGALAFLDNTQEALQAYRFATQLDPDDTGGWNELGTLLDRVGDLDDAIAAFSRVLALGETHQDQAEIAMAYGNLGVIYQTRGELDKAIKFQQKALTLNEALDDKQGMAMQYGNLGIIYKIRGELDKAIEFQQKALTINENMGNKQGMAENYGNLGVIYQTRGELENRKINCRLCGIDHFTIREELEKAIEFQQKALTINENIGNKQGMALNYGNLGLVYEIRGDLDKALEFQQKALTINENMGNKQGMALNYGNLGGIYHARGELEKAIVLREKALTLNKALDNKQGMAANYANLGAAYELKGNKAEAKRYWQMSIELYNYLGSPMTKTVQDWLDKLH